MIILVDDYDDDVDENTCVYILMVNSYMQNEGDFYDDLMCEK